MPFISSSFGGYRKNGKPVAPVIPATLARPVQPVQPVQSVQAVQPVAPVKPMPEPPQQKAVDEKEEQEKRRIKKERIKLECAIIAIRDRFPESCIVNAFQITDGYLFTLVDCKADGSVIQKEDGKEGEFMLLKTVLHRYKVSRSRLKISSFAVEDWEKEDKIERVSIDEFLSDVEKGMMVLYKKGFAL